MNSWDLFDTLVAGRNTYVAAGNQPGQYPIAENIAKVQPGDLIISDYEYPDKARQILDNICRLSNAAIVTGDGKWSGKVWATLVQKPNHHSGDNYRADVESPTQAGIAATQSFVHQFTEAEKFIHDNGFPQLSMLCREARLRTFNPRYRGIEILQADYNFPTLFLGSIVLNRRFPTETLLMSSRDCWQWVQLMQKLFSRGTYWYSSVLARTNADANYHRYIQSHPNPVLVDLCGSGSSFSKMPQYKSWLLYRPESGVKSVEAFITSPACMRLEQANVAPHEKAIGVDSGFQPIFTNKSDTDFSTEPNTAAQVNAFTTALHAMDFYDLKTELQASNEQCHRVMYWLMHKYFDFKDAVEELRVLAIKDDV